MPKKPCLRTLMDSQHVKRSERLLKSARKWFCHIFLSLGKKISLKYAILVVLKPWDSLLAYWQLIKIIVSQYKPVFNPTNSDANISK